MKEKYDVYLASPFFNQEELEPYKEAIKILRDRGLNVFVPQEHEILNAEKLPNSVWGQQVFDIDVDAIQNSKYVIVLYHGMYSDSGTAWECGYAYAIGKPVLLVNVTKERLTASLMPIGSCTGYIDDIQLLRTVDFRNIPRDVREVIQK